MGLVIRASAVFELHALFSIGSSEFAPGDSYGAGSFEVACIFKANARSPIRPAPLSRELAQENASWRQSTCFRLKKTSLLLMRVARSTHDK